YSLFVSAAAAERTDGGGVQERSQKLWPNQSVRSCELHAGPRRPRGAGGREWRGQVHANQAVVGRGAGDERRISPGAQRGSGLFRAGPIQGARSGGEAAGRPDQLCTGRRERSDEAADAAGLLLVFA